MATHSAQCDLDSQIEVKKRTDKLQTNIQMEKRRTINVNKQTGNKTTKQLNTNTS